jgi:hypothetical protein
VFVYVVDGWDPASDRAFVVVFTTWYEADREKRRLQEKHPKAYLGVVKRVVRPHLRTVRRLAP